MIFNSTNLIFAQVSPPETMEEVKEKGIIIGKEFLNSLPRIIEGEFLPYLQKVWAFLKKIWNSYIQGIWSKYAGPFWNDLMYRKSIFSEEFAKEKKEITDDFFRILNTILKSKK
jgi:hypothetical protein